MHGLDDQAWTQFYHEEIEISLDSRVFAYAWQTVSRTIVAYPLYRLV